MKQERIIMSMPAIIEIVDSHVNQEIFDEVFNYLVSIDERFSIYKKESEITLFNEGKIKKLNLSEDMKEVFRLSEEMKNKTDGFIDTFFDGRIDPSGIIKGLAIYKASLILRKKGFKNFYIEIAGDFEIAGLNIEGKKWAIGIRNPFNKKENIKVLYLTDVGIATSGTYENGNHIYNPIKKNKAIEIESITIIGPNVYEADCFATACFAMGKKGIYFIERQPHFDGYMIDHEGIATFTSNFEKYVC